MSSRPSVELRGAGCDVRGIVGSPQAVTVTPTITGADFGAFTGWAVAGYDKSGASIAGLSPEVTVGDGVLSWVWSAEATAAAGLGSYSYEVTSSLADAGPLPIMAGVLHLAAPGTPGTPGASSSAAVELDVTVGGVSVALAVTVGGAGGGASSLDELSDVQIDGTPGAGSVLRHNGTRFVNVTGTDHFDAAGAAAAAVSAHAGAADPHPGYLTAAEGVAAFDPLGAAAAVAAGLGTAAAANVEDFAADDDPRLSDARTPTAHASTHATAGGDAITPADIGAAPADHDHDGDYDPIGVAAALVADLSGVTDAATARTNLGLGSAAVEAASAFATSTQGALADGAVPKSLVDAKGDLFAGTADNMVGRLAVGTDGHVLTADSAQSTGVKWAAAAGGATFTRPPTLHDGANAYWQLPNGANIVSGETGVPVSANRLIYSPTFQPLANHRYIAIMLEITNAVAANTIRVGLVEMSPVDDQPIDLVSDIGTVSAATLGQKSITGLTLDVVAGRLYSFCAIAAGGGGSVSVRGFPGTNYGFGIDNSVVNRANRWRYVDGVGAQHTALSDPPPDWTLATNATGNNLPGALEFVFVQIGATP